MRSPARTVLLGIMSALLALAASSADAGRVRRCKRLCRPLVAACVESQGCAALPKRHDRRSCKRSCKRELVGACKADPNACSTTSTTLPPGACPGYTVTCRATTDRSASGLGSRACVDGQGELPADTTTVFVSLDAEDATQGTINVNVTGSNFDSGVVCSGPVTSSNGSLTIEQNGGAPYGTAGCCTSEESGILDCRATIDRLCDINESIVGSFEVDAQCADGTTCSRQVHFVTPRDS
jgi:hypothetical protein